MQIANLRAVLLCDFIFLCGSPNCRDRLANNPCKLISLIDQIRQANSGQHTPACRQLQPRARLTNFFQTNTQLVREISLTLRGTSLFVVPKRRRPAAHQLICNASANARVRQRLYNTANPVREIQKSFTQIVSRYANIHVRVASDRVCNLQFAIVNLQFAIS